MADLLAQSQRPAALRTNAGCTRRCGMRSDGVRFTFLPKADLSKQILSQKLTFIRESLYFPRRNEPIDSRINK